MEVSHSLNMERCVSGPTPCSNNGLEVRLSVFVFNSVLVCISVSSIHGGPLCLWLYTFLFVLFFGDQVLILA